MTRTRVMFTAVAVWATLLVGAFAFFLWLNNATGQLSWQEFQAVRDAKMKEKASRPHPAE